MRWVWRGLWRVGVRGGGDFAEHSVAGYLALSLVFVWGLWFSCGVAHCGRDLIAIFRKFFHFCWGAGTRLSFYIVQALF